MKSMYLILFVTLAISCNTFNKYEYTEIKDINTSNYNELYEIEIFKETIDKHRIRNIALTNDYFVASKNLHLFKIKRNNYNTIIDYLNGKANRFRNGLEYYDARKYNIDSFSEYQSFISSFYHSPNDMITAINHSYSSIKPKVYKIKGLYTEDEILSVKQHLNWLHYLYNNSFDKSIDRVSIAHSDEYLNHIKRVSNKYYIINDSIYPKPSISQIVGKVFTGKDYLDEIDGTALHYYLSTICLYKEKEKQSNGDYFEAKYLNERLKSIGIDKYESIK